MISHIPARFRAVSARSRAPIVAAQLFRASPTDRIPKRFASKEVPRRVSWHRCALACAWLCVALRLCNRLHRDPPTQKHLNENEGPCCPNTHHKGEVLVTGCSCATVCVLALFNHQQPSVRFHGRLLTTEQSTDTDRPAFSETGMADTLRCHVRRIRGEKPHG